VKHKIGSAAHLAHRFLDRGDAVLDIGAADGAYTRVYADRVGRTGSVLAVEPNVRHLGQLLDACEPMPWVSIWYGAVGRDRLGLGWLHEDADDPKRSSLWASNVSRPGHGYHVAVTTVDALIETMPQQPKLIQVDAQGAEADIVAGAGKALTAPIVWVLEIWREGLANAGATVDDVLLPFEVHGYTARSIAGARIEWDDLREQVRPHLGVTHADVVLVPDALKGADW